MPPRTRKPKKVEETAEPKGATAEGAMTSAEALEEKTVELDTLADRVSRYRLAKKVEQRAKEAAEEARADIAAHLEAHGAEYGTVDGTLAIRWRPVESNRLDTKKLRESHPGLVDEFTRPTTAMRMEIVS